MRKLNNETCPIPWTHHCGLFWCVSRGSRLVFWHSIYFRVWWGWKVLQPWKANSLLPLHTSGDVSSDCSKVTPGTQILPSLVGAHNNNLPNPPLPSCLSILFVYSAACLEQWLVHPHLLHSYLKVWHRQAAATVSSLPSLSRSWLCLIFLLLWILVDSVVWRLTLTSRVEAFCIKKPSPLFINCSGKLENAFAESYSFLMARRLAIMGFLPYPENDNMASL